MRKKEKPKPDSHSIVSIILRDLARGYRKKLPDLRIEAHPVTNYGSMYGAAHTAKLHVTIDHSYKVIFNLASNDDLFVVTSTWVIGGDAHQSIPSSLAVTLGQTGMDLYDISNKRTCEVSILDPNSIDELEEWMSDRILYLVKHVDSLDNHRPTTP